MLIKARKSSDPKLDYSQITVELQTIDGLVKDRTQCAPNGYYFIPVYDKGSFVVKVDGPNGWSWNPENVPITVDQIGCNLNADINFQLTGFGCFQYMVAKLNSLSCNSRFLISGKVKGAIGGESSTIKDGGPSGVKVELLSSFGDIVSSVPTSERGIYSFTNIVPDKLIGFATFYLFDFSQFELVLLRSQLHNYIFDMRSSEEFTTVIGIGGLAKKLVDTNKHVITLGISTWSLPQ